MFAGKHTFYGEGSNNTPSAIWPAEIQRGVFITAFGVFEMELSNKNTNESVFCWAAVGLGDYQGTLGMPLRLSPRQLGDSESQSALSASL